MDTGPDTETTATERIDLVYGTPGRSRHVDPRELAEGFAGRRAASFATMRSNEAFCAFVKRTAGTGLPRTEENV